MPPKCKFTKEEIIQAALDIAREDGIKAITARALGAKLNASSKPIFSLFQNMEEVQQEVIKAANQLYQQYLTQDMTSGNYPIYKASGMAYIRFAEEEKKLFQLLFMCDRSNENTAAQTNELTEIISIIQTNTGLSYDKAYLFHLEMWVYVHGIATMIATNYLKWEKEVVSLMLTDAYEGLKHRYLSSEEK